MSDTTQRCRAKSRNWSLKTCCALNFLLMQLSQYPKVWRGCAHRVVGSGDQSGGTILWEFERTRNRVLAGKRRKKDESSAKTRTPSRQNLPSMFHTRHEHHESGLLHFETEC